MDFSYFNAVLKSTTFPPYDPWFAGGYINYYYYGFVLVGMPVKLLGIIPTLAYNLILPTLFAWWRWAPSGSAGTCWTGTLFVTRNSLLGAECRRCEDAPQSQCRSTDTTHDELGRSPMSSPESSLK